ncbi:MAG: carbamoyltransferase N-terminal domain-containing protein [Planctomycetota bacterium]
MRILGIGAFHSDAAAALIDGDRVVAASSEGAFSRLPHDPAFPIRAIRFCLQHGGVVARDLDRVVFYEKPLRKFERVLATQMQAFPRSARSFARSAFAWLGDRLWIKHHIARQLAVEQSRIVFTEQASAAATYAFATSPFEAAAVLVVDDAAEWATTTIGRAGPEGLELLWESRFPHSLGYVASAITQYLGFVPGADEGLVEALGAHGTPCYAGVLGELVPSVGGGFTVCQRSFRFGFDSDRLFDAALVEQLGPARNPGEALLGGASGGTRHADIAASLQVVLEERVLELARATHRRVPVDDLCLSGALARNSRVLARLRGEGPFRRVHSPPVPGKAGAAIGCALYALHADRGTLVRSIGHAIGEPVDDRAEDGASPLPEGVTAPAALLQRLLAGERVAWVRGRMEFGPHSWGHRSLFASARGQLARSALLAAVQHVESFAPCRLALPRAAAAEFVEMDGVLGAPGGPLRLKARDALRDAAPSAIEPDDTVWLHLVDPQDDPDLHSILVAIGEQQGLPALLHADFALRGASIVRSEVEAVDAFRRSALDALVVQSRVYEAAGRRAT